MECGAEAIRTSESQRDRLALCARRYLPELAQPGFAPEAKRGWGSLSEVDTQAGSERAETPMDLSMSRGSDLKCAR